MSAIEEKVGDARRQARHFCAVSEEFAGKIGHCLFESLWLESMTFISKVVEQGVQVAAVKGDCHRESIKTLRDKL